MDIEQKLIELGILEHVGKSGELQKYNRILKIDLKWQAKVKMIFKTICNQIAGGTPP